LDKKFIIPKKRHRDDNKKVVHVQKKYEMSDKHSLISDEFGGRDVEIQYNKDKMRTYMPNNGKLNMSNIPNISNNKPGVSNMSNMSNTNMNMNNINNNIAPMQKNNIYKVGSRGGANLLLDYSEMNSNSDIDPLLVTSDMEKKFYVKVPKYERVQTPSSYSGQSGNQVFFPYPLMNEENPTSSYSTNTYNQFIKPQIQTTQYYSPNYIGYDGMIPPQSAPYVYTPNAYTPTSPYMNFKQPNTQKYPDPLPQGVGNIKLPITDKKFIKYNKK
jgi:hypothetical protein